jgi:hypothetical protein
LFIGLPSDACFEEEILHMISAYTNKPLKFLMILFQASKANSSNILNMKAVRLAFDHTFYACILKIGAARLSQYVAKLYSF